MDEHDDLPEQPRTDLRAGGLRAGDLRTGDLRAGDFRPGATRPPPRIELRSEPRLEARPEPQPELRPEPRPELRMSAEPPPDEVQDEPAYNPRAGYAQQAQGGYHQPQSAYAEEGYDEAPPLRKRAVTSLAVLALALGAFGGIIYYAYTQGMRAGTESVAPVLRADTSPTRMRPENPGGMDVPHQDKLVYDRLNPSTASQQPEVERLLPPPEAPLERPQAEEPLAEDGPPVVLGQEDGPMPGAATPPPTRAPAGSGAEGAMATGRPTVLAPPAATAPGPTAQMPPAQQPAAVPPAAVKPVPATPAPAAPATALKTPPGAPPQTLALPKTEPAKVPAAGGVRIQVGAVDAESKVSPEWSRLQKKFPADLGGLSMRSERVDLGAKGVRYRIQAGPLDEARARQICASLSAQSVGCLIVR